MFTSLINKRFGEASEQMWHFPVNEYLVIITPYNDYNTEYESSEKAAVLSKLGEAPSISYDFEIRRSRSDKACDLLEDFIRNDLKSLSFIVDDMEQLLSQTEITRTPDFLDRYRYNKANKTSDPEVK